MLRSSLPRPDVDPGFVAALLDQILSGAGGLGTVELFDENEWRRRLVVVGYVAGAAAIALGAAFGWRRRTVRVGERAA